MNNEFFNESGKSFEKEIKINNALHKKLFIAYIEWQQGKDYIKEQEYNLAIDLNNLIEFEQAHHKDFIKELKNIMEEF